MAAVVFVVFAVLYFTRTAGNLPSFLPGHTVGATYKHMKHGLAMLALAAVALVAAWFTTSPGTRSG